VIHSPLISMKRVLVRVQTGIYPGYHWSPASSGGNRWCTPCDVQPIPTACRSKGEQGVLFPPVRHYFFSSFLGMRQCPGNPDSDNNSDDRDHDRIDQLCGEILCSSKYLLEKRLDRTIPGQCGDQAESCGQEGRNLCKNFIFSSHLYYRYTNLRVLS